MLEKTWNVSARVMLDLPRNTHRYFVEPLTKTHHVTKSIWNRFIRFISSVAKGKKRTLRRVLDAIKNDVRSTTGKNIRYLRLKSVNFSLKDLNVYENPYKEVPENERWRLSMIEELINTKIDQFNEKEIDEIVEYVCGS